MALAAVAGLTISSYSAAQSVVLTGATGNSCSYSSMSVLPNGNVSVACSGGNPIGNPGSFSVSGPSHLAYYPAEGTANVARTGGTTGAVTVSYAVSGGCGPLDGTVSFADGAASGTFPLRAPGHDTVCTATISSPTAGSISTASFQFAIGNATLPTTPTQPLPDQNGCPVVTNIHDFDLKLSGADVQRMPSGTIGSSRLPIIAKDWSATGQVLIGETTASPKTAVVEVSITKCRGVIDTNGGQCYLRSSNGSLTGMTWLERYHSAWDPAAAPTLAAQTGFCQALTSSGSFYINMRYTYEGGQNCQWGVCGFTSQWNYGAW